MPDMQLPGPSPHMEQETSAPPAAPIRRNRGRFATYDAPSKPMSNAGRPRVGAHAECAEEVEAVATWLSHIPWARERFRWVLRDALDDLMDGAKTGRWCYQHLTKPEQKSLGVAVQVLLTLEFDIPGGDDLTWNIGGYEVECVFAIDAGAWEIPMEMYLCEEHGDRAGDKDGTALIVWMNEDANEWAVGLLHVTDERLRWRYDRSTGKVVRAYTRDNKRRISEDCLSEIYWLWGGIQADLPPNTLLHMLPQHRARIFEDRTSGQRRVDELFRISLGDIVRKPTVLTVAQQDDAAKRVRDSRKNLQSEGIVILGHQESHPFIARQLGLPVSEKGEWLAVRLTPVDPTDGRPKVRIGAAHWAVARPDEVGTPAPVIPKSLPTN